MNYATLDDLVLAYGIHEITQITDRSVPPVGAPDAAVADRAIEGASAEIDSYLVTRHQLPLTDTPIVLRDCACDIARYKLHGVMVPDEVAAAYGRRLTWLRDVASGRASVGPQVSDQPPPATNLPEIVSGGRVFGRDNY